MNVRPVRLVVVDDHLVVRRGIRSILEEDSRFVIAGEASTGEEAIRVVNEVVPDLVLLDLELPDMSGIDVCERICSKHPQIVVQILSAFMDLDRVGAALHAGARGYLLKDAENLNLPDQLLGALRGHHVLDPKATDLLADFVSNQTPEPQALTTREIAILRCVAEGLTNKEIGAELHLSENTVKGHLKDILAKTGAKNRIQAVLVCRERNIIGFGASHHHRADLHKAPLSGSETLLSKPSLPLS